MDFFKRLLSVGRKKRRKDRQEGALKKNTPGFSSSTPPIPRDLDAIDEDLLFNRLLRSNSTHFSVISEGTEYRSMPPIPHPINHVLRAPSVISSATQADTYTVQVHRRMLHSRTEFPDANRSGDSPSPPLDSPQRHALPTLTPGDKNRLARLRQDASVLSLLNIYDEQGNPNSQAFSNTPAKSGRYDPSLRALMGGPSTADLEEGFQESDISWADRHIRAARRNSASSSITTSSLGIPVNLFKNSLSPECLRLHTHDCETTFSSCELEINIDSLVVERGTVEDAPAVHQPLPAPLTSPTHRASQYFNFLQSDRKLHQHVPNLPEMISRGDRISEPLSQSPVKPLPPSPHGPRSLHQDVGIHLVVRDGPKQSHAQVSPSPRRRSRPAPLPPVPAPDQSQVIKPREPKPTPLGIRAPFEELHNADAHDPSTRSVSEALTTRSVSVASSVQPQIETRNPELVTDPYTPLPPRHAIDGKRGYSSGENVPPNAPARPVRGQSRAHTTKNGARPARSKKNSDPPASASSKPLPNEKAVRNINQSNMVTSQELLPNSRASRATPPPATPSKTAYVGLQTPARPSPVSSSELSPQGRRIMANIRERVKKASHNKTPHSWQSWGSKGNPPAAILAPPMQTTDSSIF